MTGVIKFWGPILLTLWGPHRNFGAPFELALLARREVAFDTHAIKSESAKHIVEGRRVEQVSTVWKVLPPTSQMRHALPMTSICKRFQRYLSKRSYPTCLCVTAFELVHFQIAYHSSWWRMSCITQSYKMGLPLMVTLLPVQQQEGTQDCRLFGIATAYCVAMHGGNPPQH